MPSPRNDILINIDEKTRNAALRFYNWKLIVGKFGSVHFPMKILAELRPTHTETDNESIVGLYAYREGRALNLALKIIDIQSG